MEKKFEFKEKYNIDDLILITEILRGENGCPWDREQDHHSVRNNFIEEVYEAVEAIDNEDTELLKEELGDVLLQVAFHARMEEEKGNFNFDDVANDVCQKLVVRHPHVFGEIEVADSNEVLKNWDAIKKQTKGQESYTDTLKSVSPSLPALMRSQKVQKRAKRAGFDWPDVSGAFSKIEEETKELKSAVLSGDKSNIEEELGDLLFSVVNVARFLDVESEEALTKSTEKFINRFSQVEKLAKSRNIDMKEESIEVLDKLWDEAKGK
jgi:tetrapyrrole methylase family protein/MazG family protein